MFVFIVNFSLLVPPVFSVENVSPALTQDPVADHLRTISASRFALIQRNTHTRRVFSISNEDARQLVRGLVPVPPLPNESLARAIASGYAERVLETWGNSRYNRWAVLNGSSTPLGRHQRLSYPDNALHQYLNRSPGKYSFPILQFSCLRIFFLSN